MTSLRGFSQALKINYGMALQNMPLTLPYLSQSTISDTMLHRKTTQ
jgi:hypothetical protein